MLTKTKIALSAALILGTASAAFAENNSVPGERNANPIAQQNVFEGRNAYEGRAQVGRSAYEGRAQFQVEAPAYYAEPIGPRSSPSIYGGGW